MRIFLLPYVLLLTSLRSALTSNVFYDGRAVEYRWDGFKKTVFN